MVHVKASLKLFFLNEIIFTKWLQVWTCLTQRLTPSEWPGYSITMVSCLISGLYMANSLSPSSLPSSPSLSICCVCVCVHHKSLWFPLCNITSYLLYCSAHYSLGSDKAAQPVSPAAANHPRVTLASASAHLGYTHCINCSTDLVNCLSAADVRKRRGESDRERERMGMISSEKRRKTASIAHCSQTPLPPLVSASFSLWTNKFAFTLGCVCFHLPNEKETFLHISLPRGFSSSTENTHSETHTAYKYDYNSSHCSNNLKCGHLTT